MHSGVSEEEIERLICITHIHEAAIKDEEINQMLLSFYDKVCEVAKDKGIRFSIIDRSLMVSENVELNR
jgi:hypothetical protein